MKNKMYDLNNIEREILKDLFHSSAGNGHDFGFTDDVNTNRIGITRKQLSGYISQLSQKGYILCYPENEFNQFSFTEKGMKYFEKITEE